MKCSLLYQKLIAPRFLLLALVLTVPAGTAFGAEGGGGLTVIPDSSVFIQIANFLFLLWVLNLILYKPIRNVLIQRKEKVTGLEQSIGAAQRDVTEKEDAFAAGIREARAKGLEQKEQLLGEAAEEEKQILARINEKAQADMAKVRDQISTEADSVRQSLMKEIDSFAEIIGQKILGRAL